MANRTDRPKRGNHPRLLEALEPRQLLSAALQTAWGIGTTSNYGQQVSAITTDGAGDVYVLGSFAGTVDFDPSPAVYNLTATGSFTYDLFLAKYSASGSLIWAKAMGSTGNDLSGGILLNASGNIMITGYFSNTINMDPNGGTTNLVSAGGTDVFVAQYDTDGNLAWAKSFGGTGDDMGNRIVSDHHGGYIITGTFQNTADLDPGAGVHPATASARFDVYMSRIDSSGNLVWSDQFTAPDNLYFADVAVDAAGNVYAAGYFAGPCDLNPGAGTQIFGAANENLCFAAKFNPSGGLAWARTFGQGHGGYGDACLVADMTLDAHNNIIIAGSFGGTVDFNPGPAVHTLTEQQSPDAFTGYVMKLNSAGAYVWSGAIVGDSWSDAYAVTTDAASNIYVSGEFNGANTFDITGTSANDTLTSRGMDDAFLAKYNAAGQLGWVEQAGGTGYDHGLQVALGPAGSVYLAGYYNDTAHFGPQSGGVDLTAVGSTDSFIAVFDQAAAVTTTTLATADVLKVGRWITLTATVSVAQGLPTGRVVIYDGTHVVGAAKLDANGTVTFRMRLNTAGLHTLTADYLDDENFLASSILLPLTVSR